ncbi:hypothetical protein VKT23_017171 [Stygiomarasmius scandens]|uniref:Uncharacterized protein n=1 Tax=Marasmiellus scandens TaxID=2682957 RepID=A0ABR1IW73_9AGAR
MIFLMTRQSSGFNTGLKRSKRQFSKLAVGSAVSVGASAQTTEASPMPLEVFTETNTSISAPRRSREDSVASSAFSPAFSFFSGSRLPPPSLPQIQEERSRNRDISTSALVTTPFGTTPFENSVHTTPAMPLTSSFYTSHPPASTVSSPSINSIQPSLYRVALGTERPLPALPTVPSSPLPSQSPPEEPSSEDTPNADSSQDQDRYSNVSYPPSYRTRPSSSAVTAPESPTTPGSSASFPLSSIPPPPPLPAHLRSSLAPIPDSEAGEIAASSQNDGETDTWMDLSRAPTYRTTLDI